MRLLIRAALLLTLMLSMAAPAAAQERTRCFRETGFCVSGKILDYWERNGGLPIFGYPIGEQYIETVEPGPNSWTGPVQWFERDRLEDHSNQGLGVLAGRLGAAQFENLVVSLIVPPAPPVTPAGGQCRFFPETSQNLCPPFRQYWEQNGGLERFGYPMSAPFTFTSGAWIGPVQYFERRRMEIHSELNGAPILLGLLGKETLTGEPSAACSTTSDLVINELRNWFKTIPFRNQMGCPAGSREVRGAEQYFEHGNMLWLSGNSIDDRPRIYVIRTSPLPVIYRVYEDTWREGDPEPEMLAPEGLRVPQRGFGKLWREHPELREMLGWGTEPERATPVIVQDFTFGSLAWLRATDFVYAFGQGDIVQGKPRSWGS